MTDPKSAEQPKEDEDLLVAVEELKKARARESASSDGGSSGRSDNNDKSA